MIYNKQPFLNSIKQFWLCIATIAMPIDSSLLDEIRTILAMDPLILNIKYHSNKGQSKVKIVNDFLYFKKAKTF